MRRTQLFLFVLLAAALAYLLLWPVPVAPVAWQAPANPGYVNDFAVNSRLAGYTPISLHGSSGPEDVAVDSQGRLFASTHNGDILVFDPDLGQPRVLANTGGRPLGIDLDRANRLLVADAYRGLLRVGPDGEVETLVTHFAGAALTYVDDVDVAPSGRVYFSDASSKFGAEASGGTLEGSLLDLMEHGGHGRVFEYDPFDGETRLLMQGLQFANGVAVSPDGRFLLVAETGLYRVLRYWLTGPRQGRTEQLLGPLPGFPDNLTAGADGRFWVALVSPRSTMLDKLAPYPLARKMAQRLPAALRPAARDYGHVVAFDETGQVLADLQDPSGSLPMVTSAVESGDFLYLGSLTAPQLGRIRRPLQGWGQ